MLLLAFCVKGKTFASYTMELMYKVFCSPLGAFLYTPSILFGCLLTLFFINILLLTDKKKVNKYLVEEILIGVIVWFFIFYFWLNRKLD